jgi:hypothetical protein
MRNHLANTAILMLILAWSANGVANGQAQTSPSAAALPENPTPAEGHRDATRNSTKLNPPGVGHDHYIRPSQETRTKDFMFDAFGPSPILGAAFVGGINQLNDSPPEWHQGTEAYFKRFGSDFGIVAVSNAARFGLAEAFKEDTLYYRCDCVGIMPRARHALFSTLTGRQGEDGHRVFSLPSLIAPYAGTFTAVYGWYPGRFGAKDAFRMGNYSLLAYAGGNLSLEFFYSGPHSLLSRMHLNNAHGAPDPGPNHPPEAAPTQDSGTKP